MLVNSGKSFIEACFLVFLVALWGSRMHVHCGGFDLGRTDQRVTVFDTDHALGMNAVCLREPFGGCYEFASHQDGSTAGARLHAG